MNKIFSSYLIGGLVALFLFFTSQNVFAAQLNFKIISDGVMRGEDTVVEVRVDPQSKKINVVEGSLIFSGLVAEDLSVQIENGNSILPLWPTSPQYVSTEKIISFAGGVPDGFDSEGLLFIMRLSSPVVGDLNISYVDGAVYLNDGKGTRENIFSEPLKISLNQADNDLKKENLFINKNKNGILVLVAIALIFFLFYVFKKITKK